MSPQANGSQWQFNRFPRASGDEPAADILALDGDRFSPRERG